jgi:hypothetical protein
MPYLRPVDYSAAPVVRNAAEDLAFRMAKERRVGSTAARGQGLPAVARHAIDESAHPSFLDTNGIL